MQMLVTVASVPSRPVIRRGSAVGVGDVTAAFRAVLEEDWQAGVSMLRGAVACYRAYAGGDGGFAANQPLWMGIAGAASYCATVAETWRRLEPDWRPRLCCTWREWWLLQSVTAYGSACLRGEPCERLDQLAKDLARLVMRGERRGGGITGDA